MAISDKINPADDLTPSTINQQLRDAIARASEELFRS